MSWKRLINPEGKLEEIIAGSAIGLSLGMMITGYIFIMLSY